MKEKRVSSGSTSANRKRVSSLIEGSITVQADKEEATTAEPRCRIGYTQSKGAGRPWFVRIVEFLAVLNKIELWRTYSRLSFQSVVPGHFGIFYWPLRSRRVCQLCLMAILLS